MWNSFFISLTLVMLLKCHFCRCGPYNVDERGMKNMTLILQRGDNDKGFIFEIDQQETTRGQDLDECDNLSVEMWNYDVESCETIEKHRRGKESFLNFLLIQKQCSKFTGNGDLLDRHCRNADAHTTEYHMIAYMRFCNFAVYKKVCRTWMKFESYSEVDNEMASGSGGGNLMDDPGFELMQLTPRDEKMVGQACRDVDNFMKSVKMHVFALESQKTFPGQNLSSKGSVHGRQSNTISIPVVPMTEWFRDSLQFCRPFAFGLLHSRQNCDSRSVYESIPKQCRHIIILSIFIDSVIAILTIVANTLVIAVGLRTRLLRNVPGYFKLSLACADIIVGLVVMPSCIFITYTFYIGPMPLTLPGRSPTVDDFISRRSADAFGFFTVFSFVVSIYTLGGASLDRYLAITKPLKYRVGHYWSRRRCIIAFVMIWTVGFLFAIYPVFAAEAYTLKAFNLLVSVGFKSAITYAVGLFIPLLAVWSLNGAILANVCFNRTARRKLLNKESSRKPDNIAKLDDRIDVEGESRKNSLADNNLKTISRSIIPSSKSNTGGKSGGKRAADMETKIARTLGMIVGGFSLALLPTILSLVVFVLLPWESSSETNNKLSTSLYVASRILLSNSFWNCIIYNIRNREFRHAIKEMLFTCK